MPESEVARGSDPAVRSAVDRALSKQRGDAEREVEAILDAALLVVERAAPSSPRVADIIAEARSSNQAFYRYFGSKDELLRAVLARGTDRVCSYLVHRIAKAQSPAEKVEAWILGVLAQVADRTAARQSRAIIGSLGEPATAEAGAGGLDDIRGLLRQVLQDAGVGQLELSTNAVFELTFAVLNRYARNNTAPSELECAHLVGFCLKAVGIQP